MLNIRIELGNLGTPAVKIGESDVFQTDEEIVGQLRRWAGTLGIDEVKDLIDRLAADLHPVGVLSERLREGQPRLQGGAGPAFEYPEPTTEEQWSFVQLVFALAMRFVAEELHRPRGLGYQGAQYTARAYKREIET